MSLVSVAQVGVGTTDPKASLDIASSSLTNPTNTDGLLIPKINNFPSSNPGPDQDGMMVYITGNGAPAKGFYYWDHGSTSWVSVLGSRSINDLVDGKSDNDGSDNGSSIFLGDGAGNSDDETNNGNVGIGKNALQLNSSGHSNLGIGFQSMLFNTTGTNNTALGRQTLLTNTDGDLNVAIAPYALYNNLSGSRNIAIGHSSLYNNQGENNVSVGINSLFNNTSGSENISIGYNSLYSATTASSNTSVGSYALFNTTTGRYNTALGTSALFSNSIGQNNTALGFWSGYNSTGNDNVYLGYRAGFSNTDNNRLFIENTDSNTPLIYGEFDTDIIRINGSLQVNNPTITGYSFPSVDGAAGQVMTTDGAGQISFTTIGGGDDDWYVQGTSASPTSINDNVYTMGKASVGNSNVTNARLYIASDVTADTYGYYMSQIGSKPGLTSHGFYNLNSLSDVNLNNVMLNVISGTNNGINYGIRNAFLNNGTGTKYGLSNEFDSSAPSGAKIGVQNRFQGGDGFVVGLLNDFPASWSINGTINGILNNINAEGNTIHYGTQNLLNGLGSGAKYGSHNFIGSTAGGIHYGVYSDVQKASGYAGYFLGRTSLGNTTTNRYVMPAADGTSGQVMTTDGAGNVSFQDATINTDNQAIDNIALVGTVLEISLDNDGVAPATVDLASLQDGTGTDDQQIDNFGLAGNILGLSIEDDSQPVQTVNLNNLSFNVNNFSLLVVYRSLVWTHGGTGYEKLPLDFVAFDTQSEFNIPNNRFIANTTGFYQINATLKTANWPSVPNDIGLAVYKNGTLFKEVLYSHELAGQVSRNLNCLVQLSASDYIEFYIYSTFNGLLMDNNPSRSWFEIQRIR